MVYWSGQRLKETIGFKSFKKDYIKIFEKHNSNILKFVSSSNSIRIFTTDSLEKQSILNYINTNILAYAIIVNDTLKKIDFNPLTMDGYNIMMEYIIDNNEHWINMLPKIYEKIEYTSGLGERKEILVKEKLIEHFKRKGDFKITSYGELGGLIDMNLGIDLVISSKSGKMFNVQIKTCKDIQLNDGIYNITYYGVNKLYNNIDYFICVVGEKVHVFDNKKINKRDGGYYCNTDGLKVIL